MEALRAAADGPQARATRARCRLRHRRSRCRPCAPGRARRARGADRYQRRDARTRPRPPDRQGYRGADCVRDRERGVPAVRGRQLRLRDDRVRAAQRHGQARGARLDASRAAPGRPAAGAGVLEAAAEIRAAYDAYSFNVLPRLGGIVAGDASSYRYLAESIRMHPDQETLVAMIRDEQGSTTAARTTSRRASSRCTSASFTNVPFRMTLGLLRPVRGDAEPPDRRLEPRAGDARGACWLVDGAAFRSDAAAGPPRGVVWHTMIRPAGDERADAVIEGTPLSFLRLATDDAARSIRAGGMDVRGDAEVAEGFRRLLEAARPDFEEEVSRFTGDAAAHYLAGFARDAAAFGRRAGDTLARNTAEYLTEESRDLPVRVEVEEFLEDVDRLREAVDRLESRVVQKAQHTKSKGSVAVTDQDMVVHLQKVPKAHKAGPVIREKWRHEGGQMPIQRRIPKRGFNNPHRVEYKVFNLGQVEQLAEKYGIKEFSLENLYINGLISQNDKVKILGNGELKSKFTF